MKKIALIAAITLLSTAYIFSQNLKWETDEEKSYKIPVGLCTWEDIQMSDFFFLVQEYSADIILNANATAALAQTLDSKRPTRYEIEAYFGAWDDESLYQLPRFYAFAMTMEAKYQQPIDYYFIGCNRNYDCGEYEEPKAMPYFKIYQISEGNQRKLIGEIFEKPKASFEEDVMKIIKR